MLFRFILFRLVFSLNTCEEIQVLPHIADHKYVRTSIFFPTFSLRAYFYYAIVLFDRSISFTGRSLRFDKMRCFCDVYSLVWTGWAVIVFRILEAWEALIELLFSIVWTLHLLNCKQIHEIVFPTYRIEGHSCGFCRSTDYQDAFFYVKRSKSSRCYK